MYETEDGRVTIQGRDLNLLRRAMNALIDKIGSEVGRVYHENETCTLDQAHTILADLDRALTLKFKLEAFAPESCGVLAMRRYVGTYESAERALNVPGSGPDGD